MEPPAAASENATEGGADRPDGRTRTTDESPGRRRTRALLGVEAAAFLVAAVVHAGVLVGGYEHAAAMVAESLIGGVLVVGLAATRVRQRATFSIAAGVQAFALLGTLVGIWTIVVGIGPRTVPDVVYHVAIVIVLAVGIRTAWRARGRASSRAGP